MLLLVALIGWPAARAGQPAPLVLCYEDVVQRPWSTPAGAGLNFELLKRVEKQLGEHFNYVAKPWKRCLEEVRTGAVDAVIGAADAPERRAFALVPTLPDGKSDPARALFTDNAYVYLRVGGGASWDGRHLRTPGNEVVVPAGYLIASLLRERGLQPRELVKSAEDALRMVASGMADAAVLQGSEASRMARDDPRFRDRLRQVDPPFVALEFHLLVGRAAHAREAARIDAIWRAIGTVRQSAPYRQRLREAGAHEH
jgi:polar amino acid transport system substrate-binding protein